MGMSVTISAATEQDAEQILKLQYLCYQSEAELYGDYGIEPLTQTLDTLRGGTGRRTASWWPGSAKRSSARYAAPSTPTAPPRIGKLIVHPRLQRHGLGGRLLARDRGPARAPRRGPSRFRLFTGHRSEGNLRLYRKLGYAPVGTRSGWGA